MSRRLTAGTTAALAAVVLGVVALGAFAFLGPSGSRDQDGQASHPDSSSPGDGISVKRNDCEGVAEEKRLAGFRVTGKELIGDVDGDGRPDRVTLREGVERPEACRRVLVVETAADDTMIDVVEPLDWPSPDPKLLLLANIDRRPGLEPVVALSPGAVFRSGEVYTVIEGELARMQLGDESSGPYPHLFPFYDEFTAGVDCTDSPGEIVETAGEFAPGGDDSILGITRTTYRSDQAAFRPVARAKFVVDCCSQEAAKRWPETADDPFRSCPNRVS